MASTCMSISTCADAAAAVVPVRATYVNLYKWPESDVAFVRSLSLNDRSSGSSAVSGGGGRQPPPKVVDSISCRQLYLRSYTFSRDDDGVMDKEDKNCLSFRKRSVAVAAVEEKRRSKDGGGGGRRRRKGGGFRRAKDMPCVAFSSIFKRLLSCTVKIDVVS